MKLFEKSITVEGKDLVGALLTAGALLVGKEPTCFLVGDVEGRKWNFQPLTSKGEPVTKLLKAWEQEQNPQVGNWSQEQENESHPFAIAMVAIHNRHYVQRIEKERSGSVAIRTGSSSIAVLGPNMEKHKEEIVLRRAGI